MNIIVVDDERFSLNGEVDLICRSVPDAQVWGFSRGTDALDYVYANPVDVAILDINMPDYDGIDLARRMKIYRPAINIIFATAYSGYYQLHTRGIILKLNRRRPHGFGRFSLFWAVVWKTARKNRRQQRRRRFFRV